MNKTQLALQALVTQVIMTNSQIIKDYVNIGLSKNSASIAELMAQNKELAGRVDLLDTLDSEDGVNTLIERFEALNSIIQDGSNIEDVLTSIAAIKTQIEDIKPQFENLSEDFTMAEKAFSATSLELTTAIARLQKDVADLQSEETLTRQDIEGMIDNAVPAIAIKTLALLGLSIADAPSLTTRDFNSNDIVLS